ncbi:putative bifunctional diguanylate cyclase/phosphodiesterase [Rugosimonospora acidiphila]|uniref:putative bifunctional diguanylate cyclase/phosphodiesterase n=1 Tax=Rugosimonospora acidiphila TaxID=556531 RepID=UPI0031EAE4A0
MRALLVRAARPPDPVAKPRWAGLLCGLVTGAALVAIAIGLAIDPLSLGTSTDFVRLAVVIAAAATAVIAGVRVRVGGSYLSLGWGEAALIVALYLIPVGWVPMAIFLGVGLAMVVLQFTQEPRSARRMLFNASSLALSGAVSASVAQLIAPPHLAALSLPVAAGLVVGAPIETVVSIALSSASVNTRTGTSYYAVFVRAIHGKLYMLVGNVTLGLLIVALAGADVGWLLVLAPMLWLLRQAYAYRLRGDDERRGWRLFAGATRSLNRLDERGVVEAAVAGAARLFAADGVEVLILRPGPQPRVAASGPGQPGGAGERPDGPTEGVLWRYRGGRGVELVVTVSAASGLPAQPTDGDRVAARPLLVGGASIGELRLSFGRSVRLTRREQMQLSAFGDALAAALHDATSHRELREMTARSSEDALNDTLTGIGNRAALLAKGDAALHGLERDGLVAFLLLDVNQFKEVNDTLGHAAGDDLLRVTARRLDSERRPGELVARLGGDEFGMLLTDLPTAAGDEAAALDHALRRARELADLLGTPTRVSGVRLAVEASIGVTVAAAGSCDMGELIRRAEMAMYRAKKDGNGSIAWYDSSGDASSTDRLALLAELREALGSSQQLVLALQPVVDLNSGAPTGVEALIRWRHPRRGELGPGEFIDVLENSELIAPFTRYVLERAVALAADWAAQGLSVPISVNLSARSLLDVRLPGEIAQLLARHRVPPHRLILEITETVVVPESRTVTEVLNALREVGVQLAVDDFGTGYSSLTFLTRVRVDEVKVDQSFVARMAESPEAMAIVRTTVELARELNLRVVAEGVETAEQRSELARLGCDSAQGYHFFRPMAAEKISGVLHQLVRSSRGRVIPFPQEGAS